MGSYHSCSPTGPPSVLVSTQVVYGLHGTPEKAQMPYPEEAHHVMPGSQSHLVSVDVDA